VKNFKFLIILFLGIFLFSGCENQGYLVSISYSEFKEMQESKENFFVEIVQDGCSYCTAFTPKLKEVLNEYKVKGYQLNLSELSDEDYKEFNLTFGSPGTPTTIFFIEGKELSKLQRISGNVSKTKIVSKLEANGYIKKQ